MAISTASTRSDVRYPAFRRLASVALASVGAATLASCMVGPTYRAPVEVPVARLATSAATSQQNYDAAWWQAFGDPVLDRLMERGLSGNTDIRVAVARVREARALFSGAQTDLFPHVTAGGSYTRSDEQILGFGTNRVNIEGAQLGFDARWEVDLFGRVRRQVQAARAEADASVEDLHGAKVTVAAEIARNYLDLRGAQARLTLARRNADIANDTLRLSGLREKFGRGDMLDVESARAQLATTEALIPGLNTTIAQATDRIAVLIGMRPGTIDIDLSAPTIPPPARATVLPIGDASLFLKQRPDVRAAERRLAAETARTGAATADLFPRISVTGFVGLLSGNVSSLFSGGSKAFAVSPAVTWPALDLGSARARLRAQQARGDVAQAEYERTVLNAIEDLQNVLTAYRERQDEVAKLAVAADASSKAFQLAQLRYRAGRVDFIRVLDSERKQLETQDALVRSQTAANTDVVAIYKALGGEGEGH